MNTDESNAPVVIIGGISGGIGMAVARRMHADGYRIAGFARDANRLQAVRDVVPDAVLVEADATDSEAVNRAFARLLEESGGRVDAYVHAIGSILLKSAHMISDREWSDTLRQNLDSAFYCLRAMVKPMQKAGHGAIVLISSVAARTGLPAHEAIAAAKAGVQGLALSAAASYASRNVRVNVVAPGLTETPMSESLLASEQGRKISAAMHPLGRVGRADEIAAMIRVLISADGEWITGQVISVDGGLSAIHQRPRVS
jgi:NAD(P)-dependent dehydrogenase (short-subunit alcohol dehydrogenase family)